MYSERLRTAFAIVLSWRRSLLFWRHPMHESHLPPAEAPGREEEKEKVHKPKAEAKQLPPVKPNRQMKRRVAKALAKKRREVLKREERRIGHRRGVLTCANCGQVF